MWLASTFRSVSQRKLFKNSQSIRSHAVSALAQLSPCYSDSSADESILIPHKAGTKIDDPVWELNSCGVIEILNNLKKKTHFCIANI